MTAVYSKRSTTFSNSNLFNLKRAVSLKFLLFSVPLLLCGFISTQAQETPANDFAAPPPLKILTKAEKEQLEGEADLKKRTKLALDLMEARLKRAEELDSQNQFTEMYGELGKFHALIDYTLSFLNRSNLGNSKSLNNFKRFEMGLRVYPPRLEVMRRNLPVKYEPYVRDLIESIRETRTKAVDNFFADTVVPNEPQ